MGQCISRATWHLPREIAQTHGKSLVKLTELFQIESMLIGWWHLPLGETNAIVVLRRVDGELIGGPASPADEAKIARWARHQGARYGLGVGSASDHPGSICA